MYCLIDNSYPIGEGETPIIRMAQHTTPNTKQMRCSVVY